MSREPEHRSVYLRPGELTFLQEPAVVSTVLGSCVSLTFFHRSRRIAAMCHALLPHGRSEESYRYVDCSALHMLESFLRQGLRREDLEIKLFGGADMFEAGERGPTHTVGTQNVRAALGFLEREGLRLAASDVGGHQGRKLLFYAHTGEVLLKRLRKQEIPPSCR